VIAISLPPRLSSLCLLVVSFALAVMLAACSSSDDSSSSGSGDGSPAAQSTASAGGGGSGAAIEACGILTAQDVEGEIGASPSPNDTPVGPFSSCGYFDTATNFVQLQVCDCYSDSQFDDAAKSSAALFETEPTPVDGVGDKAYWLEGILWIKSGGHTLNLWISKADFFAADGTALEGADLEAVALPDTKALALKLLDRLR
jgi:hypothetical protein